MSTVPLASVPVMPDPVPAGTPVALGPGKVIVSKWKVCPVGSRWGAFQPWAGEVYWLRLFDSFQLATEFVRTATKRMAIHK